MLFMNVSLTKELEELVSGKVKTGLYQAARFGGQTADPRQASMLLNLIQSFLRSR